MSQFKEEFNYIKIKLASPSRLLQWTNRKLPNGQIVGEVRNSETINYRTFKPEMDGLFCERIFGPQKNLECACGKYKRMEYAKLICEKCGVELNESFVRRHRMGHINLIYPVTHIWYINCKPNYIALLLEIEESEKKLSTTYTYDSDICDEPYCKGIKFTSSTIINLWDDRIKRIKVASLIYFTAEDEISFYGLHWDLQKYRRFRELGISFYPFKPEPKPENIRSNTPLYLLDSTPAYLMGSALIKKELEKLNLTSELNRSRCFALICTKVLKKEKPLYITESKWFRRWEQQRLYKILEKTIKRIRVLDNLIAADAYPAWMVLKVLPVIPPALRPMIQLEGGRFATSDLNELYRRIFTRNSRLVKLLEIDAPPLILRNEKRLLQESVDNLIDNGKRGKAALGSNNRPLKSLSDIIKGKYGRFRQNLLGKRVDYSGRSVIVVGPTLKLNQCGLPYEMAVELFQPFIIQEMINERLAANMKIAKDLIKEDKKIVKFVLEKILINHPIFLNRAPTLHRLGVQAFEPILITGRAIKLHPLVCSAFNADFDGDQMAIHIPLSSEAQSECYILMLAPYNFLSPANGEPIIIPSQDMVLGCYYLTLQNMKGLLGSNHYFADLEDVISAYTQGEIEIHTLVWVRYKKEIKISSPLLKKVNLSDKTIIEYYDNFQLRKTINDEIIVRYLQTTTGRVILNYTIQKNLKFFIGKY